MSHHLKFCGLQEFIGGVSDIEFWGVDPYPGLGNDQGGIFGQPIMAEAVPQLIQDYLDSTECLYFRLSATDVASEFFSLPSDCLCLVDRNEYDNCLVDDSVHVVDNFGQFSLVKMELSETGGIMLSDEVGCRLKLDHFDTNIPDLGILIGRVRAYLSHIIPQGFSPMELN